MPGRDEFTPITKRILAERAGLRCSNPDCGRATSGPSDDGSGTSTLLGNAAHITAASPGGPRYDSTLTTEQRCNPDNGIWLCAVCADRIDKRENADQYPVELLRYWKDFHESATGTDFSSLANRNRYPLRELTLINFAGVQGEVKISFGSQTVIYGTSMLSHTMSALLRIFCEREKFERIRQPRGGEPAELLRIPMEDGKALVFSMYSTNPRFFTSEGKLRLLLSDGREFIITIRQSGAASLSLGDTPIPVFSPVTKAIYLKDEYQKVSYGTGNQEGTPNMEQRLADYFNITISELRVCIQGLPSDRSIFGYDYGIDSHGEITVCTRLGTPSLPVASISRGALCRIILDLIVRIATQASRVNPPVVLCIDQSRLSRLDSDGWAKFLEWIENTKPPFQTIVDFWSRPEEGDLKRSLCYELIGSDMEISSCILKTWADFKRQRGA